MGVQTRIKLELLIPPVMLFSFVCKAAARTELKKLDQPESFQKKSIKWTTGLRYVCYEKLLRLLNILSLPMFLQLNNLLLLSKMMNEDSNCIELPQPIQDKGRENEIFMLDKKGIIKARGEFVFKNCRLNRMDKYV